MELIFFILFVFSFIGMLGAAFLLKGKTRMYLTRFFGISFIFFMIMLIIFGFKNTSG